jgi:hypothetical protein
MRRHQTGLLEIEGLGLPWGLVIWDLDFPEGCDELLFPSQAEESI